MTEKELESLIKNRETRQIEFKESFGAETIETACAFANAAGEYIILGVDDNGDISKLPLRDEALRDYENRIATSTEPSSTPELLKTVLLFTATRILWETFNIKLTKP